MTSHREQDALFPALKERAVCAPPPLQVPALSPSASLEPPFFIFGPGRWAGPRSHGCPVFPRPGTVSRISSASSLHPSAWYRERSQSPLCLLALILPGNKPHRFLIANNILAASSRKARASFPLHPLKFLYMPGMCCGRYGTGLRPRPRCHQK